MDYLLTQRRRIVEDTIMRDRLKSWLRPNVYNEYAKDKISVLSLEPLIVKVNLVSENRYLSDPFVEQIKRNKHSEKRQKYINIVNI